jgi:hypothetical protein
MYKPQDWPAGYPAPEMRLSSWFLRGVTNASVEAKGGALEEIGARLDLLEKIVAAVLDDLPPRATENVEQALGVVLAE